jgi:ankyrin repeat protein
LRIFIRDRVVDVSVGFWRRREVVANADVNDAAELGGRTALQAATEGGQLEIIEKLLAANADVNVADERHTKDRR